MNTLPAVLVRPNRAEVQFVSAIFGSLDLEGLKVCMNHDVRREVVEEMTDKLRHAMRHEREKASQLQEENDQELEAIRDRLKLRERHDDELVHTLDALVRRLERIEAAFGRDAIDHALRGDNE